MKMDRADILFLVLNNLKDTKLISQDVITHERGNVLVNNYEDGLDLIEVRLEFVPNLKCRAEVNPWQVVYITGDIRLSKMFNSAKEAIEYLKGFNIGFKYAIADDNFTVIMRKDLMKKDVKTFDTYELVDDMKPCYKKKL